VSAHRERAVGLLVNYFEAIAKKAGMSWDADYTAEIGEAVDAILAEAVDEHDDQQLEIVRRLDKHEREIRELQDGVR
jgi:hypothetical protein